MTNVERVLDALRTHGPLTDTQLRKVTGISPHQQVNQICHALQRQGRLIRAPGPDGRIVNTLVSGPAGTQTSVTPPPPTQRSPARPPSAPAARGPEGPITGRQLIILPCSGRKIRGGQSRAAGRTIAKSLPRALADRLNDARARLARIASVDEDRLLPAWQRYRGTLYQSAGTAFQDARAAGTPVVIISGGYGLVLAEEPIGWYDRRFSPSDWPRGLLEACLETLVGETNSDHVLAFCAQTTGYAKLVRHTRWGAKGATAHLLTPDTAGRGGAMVLVPRASGEAFAAAVHHELMDGWVGSDGIGLTGTEYR